MSDDIRKPAEGDRKQIGNVVFKMSGKLDLLTASLAESRYDFEVRVHISDRGEVCAWSVGGPHNSWAEAAESIEQHLLRREKILDAFADLPSACSSKQIESH